MTDAVHLAIRQPGRSPAFRLVVLLIALLGVLAFVVRGYGDEREALHFRDFKQPYASARCVLQHCDPYSETDTRRAFLAAGGVDNDPIVWTPYSALYPPFSLVALTPIAALPYPVAHALWEVLIAVSFSAAALLIAALCASAASAAVLATTLLLAAFTFSSTILLMLGQISGVVIALLAIGFFCLIRHRFLPIAVLCFTAAVLLKPHDAALPLLYLLFAGRHWRHAFASVFVLSVVFAAGSLVWFQHMPATAHWLPELQANLAGNAAPGAANNPAGRLEGVELTNLQALYGLLHDRPAFYNDASFATTALLLAAWLVPVIRLRNTFGKHALAIAAIACLALLPVYHRQYDTRILLLTFPAAAFLLSQKPRRIWGLLGSLLLAAATVLVSHHFHRILLLYRSDAIEHASAARCLLLYRPIEISMLILCLYFLLSLWLAMREQGFAPATREYQNGEQHVLSSSPFGKQAAATSSPRAVVTYQRSDAFMQEQGSQSMQEPVSQSASPLSQKIPRPGRSVAAAFLLTLLLCLAATARQLHKPNLADFEVYAAAAETVHEHSSVHMYDDVDTGAPFSLRFVSPELPLSQAAHRLGIAQVRLYIYPPILADLVLPLTFVNAHTAGKLWVLLNLLALSGTAFFTARLLGVRPVSLPGGALLVGLLLLYSTAFCLIWGQVTILLLLFWTAGMYFYQRGWYAASAFLFALATAIKLTPLVVVAPMLVWREWRWLRDYAISLAALIALMVAVNGWAPLADYARHVMPTMAAAGTSDFENKSLLSSVQLLYAALHGNSLKTATPAAPHGIITAAKAASLALAGVAFLLVLRLGRAMTVRDRLLSLALFGLLSVCIAPISWKHAYIVAYIPLALMWARAFQQRYTLLSLSLLTFASVELGSFFFDSVATKVFHGVPLGLLSFLAPGTGLFLVLWQIAAMQQGVLMPDSADRSERVPQTL